MSDRVYLGTRKGLITIERDRQGKWQIDRVHFLGEPVTQMLHDPRDHFLYACLTLGHFGVKLHRSTDSGADWEEIAAPVYPPGAEIAMRPDSEDSEPGRKPASLDEIWALEAGGLDEPNTLWAGTIPGALFRSDDCGRNWQLVESLWNREERFRWFGGGKDDPGIHSICVDPRDSRHVTVGISCGGVWTTRDRGDSWSCIGEGLRAEFMPPDLAYDPNIQDPHRLTQSLADPEVMWVQHHNGIFHSRDGAAHFQEVPEVSPATFGFAVCADPTDPQTAWFVPGVKDECRVPVDGRLVVTRTQDGGESFEALSAGLPQEQCYDLVYRHGLDVSQDGKRLAMGSTTGNLWISEDRGEQWQSISTSLPPIYAVRFHRTHPDELRDS